MSWGEPANERVKQIAPYRSYLDNRFEGGVGRRGTLVRRVREEKPPQAIHSLVVRWDERESAERGIPPEAVGPLDVVELLGELA